MKKLILFIYLTLLVSSLIKAQCSTAEFTSPDTICANNPTTIVNTSSGATSYQWDFCGGNFSQPYMYALDDQSNPSNPRSMNVVNDGTNWFGFCMIYPDTIVRYDFGSSLDNIPIANNLGTLGGAINGFLGNNISFLKEDSNWYGVVALYGTLNIVTIYFGPNLNNPNPTTTTYTNSLGYGALNYQDLKIDSGNIYLFIPTDYLGRLIKLSYGNSITNTPAASEIDLTLPGDFTLEAISLVKYCNQWYGFVTSQSTNSIVRLDFGTSLNNIPAQTDLGNPGGVLNQPTCITMAFDGENWYAIENNNTQSTYVNLINFGKDLTDTSLTGVQLTFPGVTGIGIFSSVVKDNTAFYLFGCNFAYGKFSKIKYEPPCSANPQTSTQTNPVVTYDSGGTYVIFLTAIDSSGNVSYFSDSVAVNYAPTAYFSFQNTCFPETTEFQNLSYFPQGAITSRLWDFGDLVTDTSLNPNHKYALPGQYIVTLTLTGSLGCNAVYTDTVNIGAVPVANFSTTAGCSNVPVMFTDSTTIGYGNTITVWHWGFGNGDTSNVQNPVYEYPVGGSYTDTLIVTSNYNCSATYQMNIIIRDAPNAGFTVANTCVGRTAIFTDTSTIDSGSITVWHWNFGDNDTSTSQSPTHFYADSVSIYTVSLVAQSANGCSDTTTLPVKINNIPHASFSFAPTTICEGNTVNFYDSSTVAGDTIYAWHWDFGDADSSLSKNTTHSYALSGTYNIVLTVYSQTSCSSSDTQMVTVVKSPTAGFNYNITCLGDSTYFNDTSLPSSGTFLSSWQWDFGDSSTSILTNPVHYYDSAGTYPVTLLITDNIGCTNVYADSVSVHSIPVASFSESTGCTSTPLMFFNTSTSADGAISVNSWNFGDPAGGSADSSTDPEPTYTYYSAGVYTVSLFVTTAFGCSDSVTSNIAVQQASAANFTYLPACEGQQTIFTNQDTIPALDSLWSWTFGDGGVSYIQSPSHYYVFAGTDTVTLSVTSLGGCVNTITKTIEVKPNPVADFVTAPGCINTPYLFQDISTVSSGSIEKWYWTFGNGDSSYIQFPQTIYNDTGDYVVTLQVISDTTSGCNNFVTKTIHVYPLPVANFNYDPLFGSPPLTVYFNNLSSGGAVYSWQLGDGNSSTDSTPSNTYQDTGKFNITQVVYSAEGCADSMTKVIYVIKPRLDIAVTVVSYTLNNNLFNVSAEVVNLGTIDINNYEMQASIQDGAIIDEFVNTPLPSGAQGIIKYNFTASFQISAEQNINYYCVSALNPNGETDDNPSNNEKCATLTNNFTVVQPFPNPFTDNLQLQFILPYKGEVTVELFDDIGQNISTIFDGNADAGGTTLNVSTASLASGIYFCRFIFADQTLIYPIVKNKEN